MGGLLSRRDGAIVRGPASRAHRPGVPTASAACPVAVPAADGTRVPSARDTGGRTVGSEDADGRNSTSGRDAGGRAVGRRASWRAARRRRSSSPPRRRSSWLRIDNGGDEPAGRELVARHAGSSSACPTASPAPPCCSSPRHAGSLGAAFVVVAVGAALTAVSIQYAGYHEVAPTTTRRGRGSATPMRLVAAARGRRSLAARRAAGSCDRPGRTGTLVAAVRHAPSSPSSRWPLHRRSTARPGCDAVADVDRRRSRRPLAVGRLAHGVVAGAHAAPTTRSRRGCWPVPSRPGWRSSRRASASASGRSPDSDVVARRLRAGHRAAPRRRRRRRRRSATAPRPCSACRTATLEWAVLASGIVAVYTGVVVGLGTLVGGSGPTWLLVAATGAIAARPRAGPPPRPPARRPPRLRRPRRPARRRPAHRRPARRRRRRRPAAGASSPACSDELRLDAVAIDLRVDRRLAAGGADRPADHPPPRRPAAPPRRGRRSPRRRLGRPSRRCAIATSGSSPQLAGPLSLAVGWVRLADDLRRSSVAVVSAREEERRRLRRDLHDGLGPVADRRVARPAHRRAPARRGRRPGRGRPGPRPARAASPTRSTPSSSSSSGSSATCARPPSTSSACVGAVAEFTRAVRRRRRDPPGAAGRAGRAAGGGRGGDLPHRDRGRHQRRAPRPARRAAG